MELSEILKVWAEDSANVSSPTQGQIGDGIVLNSAVKSDDPNAALQLVWLAVQYLQRTAGLYSALIPYISPNQATVIQYVGGQYYVRKFLRTAANPTSTTNNPPITGASIVVTDGVSVYSGGTDNTDWVEVGPKTLPSVIVGALSLTSMATNWTNAGRTIADLGTVQAAIIQNAICTGGSINGTPIGATNPSTGAFYSLSLLDYVVGDKTVTFNNANFTSGNSMSLSLAAASGSARVRMTRPTVNTPATILSLLTVTAAGAETERLRINSEAGTAVNVYGGLAVDAGVSAGGGVALKWKVLTGNLGTSGTDTIAHGCGVNVLGVMASASPGFGAYNVSSSANPLNVTYTGTVVQIGYGGIYNSQPYKIIVWYE